MKSLLTLLLFTSFSAFSADIIIEIGGVRHQCTPLTSGNPITCIDTAYRGPFSKDESEKLCAGAFNDGPALCGIDAYRGSFSREESIKLCIGAISEQPAACAHLAYRGPFSRQESLDLCERSGTERRAVCAIDAYRGPYSREEALKLCKGSSLTSGLIAFSKKFNLKDKDSLDSMIKEANLKAFERNEYK